jgi:alginate O-acetyltransferase complex protein AlgI
MLFNSIDFAIFLPIVFCIYWFVVNKSIRLQNFFMILAGYVFYGWWDWRFLALLFVSTIVDFSVGIALGNEDRTSRRKLLISISLLTNLGMLGFFKYYNFFLDAFVDAFTFMGGKISPRSLNVILPVGISFYSFQTLSYTLDVYRKRIPPTKDFLAFTAFVSFFPQLVAGPIERAAHMIPQFHVKRYFEYDKAVDGVRQILWGLFKKMVIADNCAEYANHIFNNSANYSGSTLVIGAVFFAFQIYCDFSGYSDIAIGTARLFGFGLMRNFAYPYFARDIAEFWRRWHISLTTWFRDYLYIPLGGSKGSTWKRVRNTFIIFLVSGFWHGANWTFIAWGLINAIYFLPLLLTGKHRIYLGEVAKDRIFPTLKEFFQMLGTFAISTFAWIFFRAQDISHAFSYIGGIFSWSLFEYPKIHPRNIILLLILFIIMEWNGRDKQYAIENTGLKWPQPLRHVFYYLIVISILYFGGKEQQFIYFQF